MLLKRPSSEELFEFISIPQELSWLKRNKIALQIRLDSKLNAQVEKLRDTWTSYFKPEPDVMDSVMRVYSKLRSDETVILKGWKLCQAHAVVRPKRDYSSWGVVGTAGVAAAVGAIVLFTGERGQGGYEAANGEGGLRTVQMMSAPIEIKRTKAPLARIRTQDRNSVQVQYVQPELLQSIEFETTGTR